MALSAGPAPSNLRGAAAMIAATGFFVVCDSFMKAAMADLPPFEVLFLRGIAATLICGGLVVIFGHARAIGGALHPRALGRAFFEMLSVLCYIVALANMPIADVVAIGQIAPLMLVLAAAVILREPIGAMRLAFVAAGFVGAILVAQPTAGGISIYALLAFGTALGIAVRDLVGRGVPASVPTFVATFGTNIIVMSGAAVMMLLQESWVPPGGRHILYLAAAGLFVSLGHVAIFLAYRYGAAGVVAPFFYIFAVWAVIVGYAIFGEVPNTLALVGIAMIVVSGLFIVLSDRRRAASAPHGELDL